MNSLLLNKYILVGVILILTYLAIYKPSLPKQVKSVINNTIIKLLVITLLAINSKYTIEFSLILAITILTLLDVIKSVEHFEDTNLNIFTDACKPKIPDFLSNVNEDMKVIFTMNTSLITDSGKCKISKPYNNVLNVGVYKNVVPSETDTHYLIPSDLINITKKEFGINKEIHLFMRKGYKITFELLDDSKTNFSTTPNLDLTNTNSDDIKKILENIKTIIVEKI